MAYLIIVANIADQTIGDLNGRAQFPTKTNESLEGCRFVLEALEAGTLQCTNVQISTSSSAPTVTPTGSGATQQNYSK